MVEVFVKKRRRPVISNRVNRVSRRNEKAIFYKGYSAAYKEALEAVQKVAEDFKRKELDYRREMTYINEGRSRNNFAFRHHFRLS